MYSGVKHVLTIWEAWQVLYRGGFRGACGACAP